MTHIYSSQDELRKAQGAKQTTQHPQADILHAIAAGEQIQVKAAKNGLTALRADAAKTPLTRDQTLDAFCHTPDIHQFVTAFFAGVAFAEKHHAIAGEKK